MAPTRLTCGGTPTLDLAPAWKHSRAGEANHQPTTQLYVWFRHLALLLNSSWAQLPQRNRVITGRKEKKKNELESLC